jgi:Tfp pilus assembly protein PilV
VVIAMAILAVVVTSILEIRQNCIEQGVKAGSIQTANMLAERIISTIQLSGEMPSAVEGETFEGYAAYPYSISTEKASPIEDVPLQKVTIRIKFPTISKKKNEDVSADASSLGTGTSDTGESETVKDNELVFVFYMREKENE